MRPTFLKAGTHGDTAKASKRHPLRPIGGDANRFDRSTAFERVEAISGRSSNMQRHVKTCDYISAEQRARIMGNFEASQAVSRDHPSKDPEHTEGDIYSRHVLGPTPWVPGHAGHPQSNSSRSRATSRSDDEDGASSSSMPSPDTMVQRELSRPMEMLDVAPNSSRPAPRISLKSILNDSDAPTYPYNLAGANNGERQPEPSSPELLARGHGLVARLDHAIDEIQNVRTRLEDQSGPQGQGIKHSTDSATLIAWLQKRLEEVHKENEWLKRRYSYMESDNGDLKARLDRVGEKLSSIELGNNRMPPRSPRANSAPAPSRMIELESQKRRKLDGGSGFLDSRR